MLHKFTRNRNLDSPVLNNNVVSKNVLLFLKLNVTKSGRNLQICISYLYIRFKSYDNDTHSAYSDLHFIKNMRAGVSA